HAAVLALAALLVAAIAAPAPAITIGFWSGGGRTWNNSPDFSNIKSLMTASGHIVEADEAMTADALADNQMWLIGAAASVPGDAEMTALSTWVHAGGTLLVLADGGGTGVASGNTILPGIGSHMVFSVTNESEETAPLAGGIFATEGPPSIVGQNLLTSPSAAVSGGTVLAGSASRSYIEYEALGFGYVFAFGDRSDHDAKLTSGDVNGKLFLNLAAGSRGIIPEPLTALGLMAGIGGLAGYLRRRRR
ncbi:MAG: PEP-CTERM sorting domain-containing protein, partial [Planctomycetes bacterium]|nr:PEP-CTERM sorting domain-containing protein [Planctomycetota bacterium]